ncbi:MAG TPA: hypothetical protein VG273_06445 [Bryobacteraceae bacterium]|jgi:hypothetical protein|nr:hypothetical protein [Bryobacteraceae bacterium]
MTLRKVTPRLSIAIAAAGLMLAGCGNNRSAQPAPAQKSVVTSTTDPVNRPVAVAPDGSAANTGNRVNGTQNPDTATGRPAPAGH